MISPDMTKSEYFFALIEQQVASSKKRVFQFEFEGCCYIVKMQQKTRSRIGYWILTILAKILFIPALRGIHIHGGRLTQTIEVKRLTSLSEAGVLVPKVIYEGRNYFVMSSLGETNFDFLLNNPGSRPLVFYWKQMLTAILNVHHKGGYLSQAFVRNMISLDGVSVGFIDFEDDPGVVMTLTLAQVRDWLLFFLSSSSRLDIDPNTQAKIILIYLQQDRAEVQKEVLAYASKIALLAFIFRRAKPYRNRELQSLNVLIQVMQALASNCSKYDP